MSIGSNQLDLMSSLTRPLDSVMAAARATARNPGEAGRTEAGRRFQDILGRAEIKPDESPEIAARRSAEQFVAMTLVQPLLKQLRETSQAAPPFAPTQGEKQFQGVMDAELAQRIVGAANFPLVDRLAQDMLRRSPAARTADV